MDTGSSYTRRSLPNVDSIWLYQYEPLDKDKEIGDDNIIKFCEAAANAGFLRRKK